MSAQEQELTYRDVANIIRNSWLLIGVCAAAGVALGVVMVIFWTPVYRAQVLMAPVAAQTGEGALSRLMGQFGGVAGALGIGGDEGQATRSARVATLSSRRLTDEFIRERNALPYLFPKRWDAANKKWLGAAPTLDQANQVFGRDVRSVNEDRRTNLVTLAIEFTDRKLAAEWANDLAARANNHLRERAILEARRSIEFLEGELKNTSVVERQQIILRLIETKTSEIMMANARPEYAFAIVDPAVVPDADNFVEPRRVAVVFVAALFGLALGLLLATMRWMRGARAPAG